MNNDDKPFACSAMGCGMQFTNEDHLTVHMRKHEMSLALNLGSTRSPMTPLFIDQTPTPSKFLKYGEEIGLFHDLGKNPFEEAFKKAADVPDTGEVNTPIIPLPGPLSNSDNVRTSHVPRSPSKLSLPQKTAQQLQIVPDDSDNDEFVIVDGMTGYSMEMIKIHTQTINKPSQPIEIPKTDSRVQVLLSTSKTVKNLINYTRSKPAVAMATNSNNTATKSVLQTITSASTGAKVTAPVATSTLLQPQQYATMQVFLQLPGGQTVPVQTFTNSQVVTMPAVTPPGTKAVTPISAAPASTNSTLSITKQKLKAALQQNTVPAVLQSHAQTQPNISQQNALNLCTKEVLGESTTQPQTSPTSSTFYGDSICASDTPSSPDSLDSSFLLKRPKCLITNDEDPEKRRKKFLERNRAAAARCRMKRKHWVVNLEKKADDLQNTNSRLQSEVNVLRTEVAQLKTLLLAHKDCPVTLQQKAQGQLSLQTATVDRGGVVLNTSTSLFSETTSYALKQEMENASESLHFVTTVVPSNDLSTQEIVLHMN